MNDANVKELVTQLDEVRQVVQQLNTRMAQIEAQKPGTIRTDHPHIVRVQGVCGGRPIIKDTRLSVKLMVGWTQQGMTPAEIIEQYPYLSAAQIADALAYYQAHPEEIDAEFAEEKRYLEVELPRIQAIIADNRLQEY